MPAGSLPMKYIRELFEYKVKELRKAVGTGRLIEAREERIDPSAIP